MYAQEGKNLPSKELVLSGEDALKIAEALTSTTLKILQILWQEHLDISTIGRRMGLSEAYISEQVRMLEDLKLVDVTYERGKRGIRKVCAPAVEKITLVIKEGSSPPA